MELHSYAKLRGYKKWTIQQKRKLVEARINYDGIFSRKSSNCIESWKKIMATAKLNEFNVMFVRKQWANLLAKYKVYKRSRLRQLGRNGEISDQLAREISEEWEFFYPIHSFMSKKPTNFHTYAQNPCDAADENGNGVQDEEQPLSLRAIVPNTDHDFYSKSPSREIHLEPEKPTNQMATGSNNIVSRHHSYGNTNNIKLEPEHTVQAKAEVQPPPKENPKKKRKPSERDKYYKHKRRYDRRNERRFDALLNVFGQMVKQHYPNVDTSKLDAQSDQISTEEENDSYGSENGFMEEDSEYSDTDNSPVGVRHHSEGSRQ